MNLTSSAIVHCYGEDVSHGLMLLNNDDHREKNQPLVKMH